MIDLAVEYYFDVVVHYVAHGLYLWLCIMEENTSKTNTPLNFILIQDIIHVIKRMSTQQEVVVLIIVVRLPDGYPDNGSPTV